MLNAHLVMPGGAKHPGGGALLREILRVAQDDRGNARDDKRDAQDDNPASEIALTGWKV